MRKLLNYFTTYEKIWYVSILTLAFIFAFLRFRLFFRVFVRFLRLRLVLKENLIRETQLDRLLCVQPRFIGHDHLYEHIRHGKVFD